MNKFLGLNSHYLHYLDPLIKWRILDLKALSEELNFNSHPRTLEKAMRKMEKLTLIKVMKEPVSRKKFFYLSGEGMKFVCSEKQSQQVNEETLLHDCKVSEISRELLKRQCIHEVKLEHELFIKGSSAQIPDACFIGKNKGHPFKMAFELELTRKSQDRVLSKIKRYMQNDYYEYVLYLFCHENLMKSYARMIEGEIGQAALARIMLFWNPTLLSRRLNLSKGKGFFKGKEVCFDEIIQ